MRLRALCCLVIAMLAAALPSAQQWPRFRGNDNGDIADDPALPETWSETENVRWKTDIPGTGWSSSVVWGDHVFLIATIGAASEPQPIKGLYDPGDENGRTRATAEHRWMIYDVDFQTGKIRWEHELAAC
jgi:hypothetical protein